MARGRPKGVSDSSARRTKEQVIAEETMDARFDRVYLEATGPKGPVTEHLHGLMKSNFGDEATGTYREGYASGLSQGARLMFYALREGFFDWGDRQSVRWDRKVLKHKAEEKAHVKYSRDYEEKLSEMGVNP